MTTLTSRVKYLAEANEDNTATYYASQAGVDQAQEHDGLFAFQEVQIQDARSKTDWRVDREVFQFIEHASAVKNYHDDEEVKSVFYKEVEELLLKHIAGAKRIEVFDHTRRASTAQLRKETNCREPSAIVHNDYTAQSANKRLKDMLPNEAEELCQERFAIVNLWRSTAGTVESAPLAFCDSTSIHVARDLIAVKRVAKDRIGELQMALYDSSHQWYYFPQMTKDEVLIFKTFDSEPSGVNRFTLHTALTDVGGGEDAVPRQSIEIRAFVFF